MEFKDIFDTNVWVSFFNSEDSKHVEAVDLAESYSHILIPDFILHETLTVLKIRSGLDLTIKFYEFVKSNLNVKIEQFDINSESFYREFLLNENRQLSYIDSSLLTLHKTGKFKVITFDKNLQKLIKKSSK